MPKPADLFLGVVEFFAVLLPGACLTWLLQPLAPRLAPVLPTPGSVAEGWIVFLVLAYLAGHLLHAAGSLLLDRWVYGRLYLPRWRPAHVRAARHASGATVGDLADDDAAASTLLGRVLLGARPDARGSSVYDWCLSTLRVRCPAGAAEVDRVQADSKLFRSLVLVFVVAAAQAGAAQAWPLAAGALALAVFSAARFCGLRWDATQRAYEYYLLTQPATGAAAPATGGD